MNELPTKDHQSYELGSICLKLRNDLCFRRQQHSGHVCYVIEDPIRHAFHRIGSAEYIFLSLLDGQTPITEAVSETSSRAGEAAFTETQAAALCQWLVESGLAETPQSSTADRLHQMADVIAGRKRRERLNPLMLKVPLGNPGRILNALTPMTSWFFGPLGLALWCVALVTGVYHLTASWSQLSDSAALFSPDNWIWLATTWLVLKGLHELAHGIACRRFGGSCSEAGILLLLFVPLPYVNVSTAWRFGSAFRRIIVSAAGMYVELFAAALAMLLWVHTDSALVQHHCVNVMVTAGLATLLFNLNPLMKFDGYHILSDLLQLPNLALHGQQDLKYLAGRLFFGGRMQRPEWPEGRHSVIRTYGIAAFAWRIVICVSLALAAEQLYHGAGLILAACAVTLWLAIPLWKLAKYLVVGSRTNPPNRLRFAATAMSLAAIGWATWNWLPWGERVRFPAIVAYQPETVVRSSVAGFVHELPVQSGSDVHAGETLLVLSNPELDAKVAQMQLAIQQSKLDATGYHRRGELAALQVEQETLRSLRKRLAQLELQQQQLIVRAPVDGTVVTRRIDTLHGQWVRPGTTLLSLGDSDDLSIEFFIAQQHLDSLKTQESQSVKIEIWGDIRNSIEGKVVRIDPTASTTLRHPALAAALGGPMEVQAAAPTKEEAGSPENQWRLTTACFVGSAEVAEEECESLGVGQRGFVEITTSERSLGEHVMAQVSQFFDERRQVLK